MPTTRAAPRPALRPVYHSKTAVGLLILAAMAACGGGGGDPAATPAPASPATQRIEGLTATRQADGVLHYTGSFMGSAVRFSHVGPAGQGQWFVHAGSGANRAQVTISDTQGLQSILNLTTGARTTIRPVGTQRVEYRQYDAQGRFVLGAVLYASGGRWFQGLMPAEAFAGYDSLRGLTDVTTQIDQGTGQVRALIALGGAPSRRGTWPGLQFIASAHAQADSAGSDVFLGVTWDAFKSASVIGVTTITGIVTATLGVEGTAALIVSAATVVAPVAVPAAAVLTAGYLIGTLASELRSQTTVRTVAASAADEADYRSNQPVLSPDPVPPEALPGADSLPTVAPRPDGMQEPAPPSAPAPEPEPAPAPAPNTPIAGATLTCVSRDRGDYYVKYCYLLSSTGRELKQGLYEEYEWEGNQLINSATYANDVLEGPAKYFGTNGQATGAARNIYRLQAEGDYRGDQPVGTWRNYYVSSFDGGEASLGKLSSEVTYGVLFDGSTVPAIEKRYCPYATPFAHPSKLGLLFMVHTIDLRTGAGSTKMPFKNGCNQEPA